MRRTVLAFLLGIALAQGGEPFASGELRDLTGLKEVLNRPGVFHLVVPQITPWALELKKMRTAGPTVFYIPKGDAAKYCGMAEEIRVLPGEVKNPVGFILVQGETDTFDGVMLRGLGLIQDPGWREDDHVAMWVPLVGPRTARAWVEGSWTGTLTAQVEFQVVERYLGDPEEKSYLFPHPWDGRIEDVRARGYDPNRTYNFMNFGGGIVGDTLPLVEESGVERGYCALRSRIERTELGVDTSRMATASGVPCCGAEHGSFTFDPGSGLETFRTEQTKASCFLGCFHRWYKVYDMKGRYRGRAEGWQCGLSWCQEARVYPLLFEERKLAEEVLARIRPWKERIRWEPQGTFPVGPGGWVDVNGERYQIPGFEAYGRRPENVGIEWIRGEPFVSRMAMATGILGGTVYPDQQVIPLRDYCASLQ